MRDRFRLTPRSAPFVLHLAEGVDADASQELPRLEAPAPRREHRVGAWRRDHARRMAPRGTARCECRLVSGLQPRPVRDHDGSAPCAARLPGRVALGTDSRLSGSRDLLDELHVATREGRLTPDERLALVTSAPAEVLRCRQMGRLVPGGFADLIVLPAQGESAGEALSTCRRHHLRWWCWMDDRVWACRSGLKYSARVASRPLRCVWTESNGSQTRECSAPRSSSACTSRSASVSLTSTNVGRGFSRAEIQVAKRFDRSLDRERPNAHGPGRRGRAA